MSPFPSGILHWTLIPDHVIYGHNYTAGQPVLSRKECMQECENLIPVCLEAKYKKDGVCFIGTISPWLVPISYNVEFDMYLYCEMRITNGNYFCL